MAVPPAAGNPPGISGARREEAESGGERGESMRRRGTRASIDARKPCKRNAGATFAAPACWDHAAHAGVAGMSGFTGSY
ncbi:hypothetical protein WS62_23795 [Burkholderia sp. ABCPW 14]|nr:hypothetical protein WS62_23795 [Burkholderia sp. ABCPW 14]